MKLKWYGHASFLVTTDSGLRIITDPFTPETSGYPPVTDTPDIVIMSSDNDLYHCRADLLPGTPTVINALEVAQNGGQHTVHDITFHAIESMEALDRTDRDPDQNAMYRFTVDGVSIGHMGDVGNALSPEQIEFFQGVDVLLALAGGPPVIRLPDLKAVIDIAKPKIVVPMHFRTLTYKPRNMLWLKDFLSFFDESDVDLALHYETAIMPDQLPEKTRVLVIDYVHQR